MKPYPKYKDSGIEWLGEIPEHWNTKRIKFVASLQSGSSITSDNIDIEGKYPVYGGNGLRGYTAEFTHEGRYVLIGRQGALCGNINYASGKFWASEHAVVATLLNEECEIWFGELLRSMNLNQYSVAAAQPGLAVDRIKELGIPYAPVSEQKSIASFLDRKTAQIDSLIEKKRKMIELLKEERAAIINQAVTKGLNPDVEMKDSGIEWLGEVPRHWEVKKLKYFIQDLESGVSVNSIEQPISAEDEYGILKTSCVYNYMFDPKENKQIVSSSELQRAKLNPRENSIIISRMNTPELVGASGYVDMNYTNIFLPDRLWQTVMFESAQERISTRYISIVLVCDGFRQELSTICTGTSDSMKNISKPNFLSLAIPVPPIDEQLSIENYVQKKDKDILLTIARLEGEISLIDEYRTSLINETVTGKIDVQGIH